MHEHCPHCGADFQNEPGFYLGAMYVSYAFTVAIFVGCWIALRVLLDPSLATYMLVVIIASIIFAPFNFRLSRIIWLYWFGGLRFDPSL
jgi:uncharacterized protein (DUF983 family)